MEVTGDSVLAGAVLVVLGVALLLLGLRSRGRGMPRNRVFGLRTLTTLDDDEAWDFVHRHAADDLVRNGVVTSLLGALVVLLGGLGRSVVDTLMLVVAAASIGHLVWVTWRAHRAWSQRQG